jgi:hypothetical protein
MLTKSPRQATSGPSQSFRNQLVVGVVSSMCDAIIECPN